jgi:hypothetical protein
MAERTAPLDHDDVAKVRSVQLRTLQREILPASDPALPCAGHEAKK